MLSLRFINPQFAAWVASQRLDDLGYALRREDGEVVSAGHRDRDVMRLDFSGAAPGEPRRVYVKREHAALWKNVAGQLVWSGRFAGKVRAEFEMLTLLAAAGIDAPRPIVCLQSGLWPVRGCLVLAELTGVQPLHMLLAAEGRSMSPGRRQELFTAVGRETARLHAAGVNQPDLFSIHVYAGWEANRWRVAFLDFQRSRRFHHVPLRERIRDLAALAATLPPRLADGRDRQCLFDAYLAAAHLHHAAGILQTGVQRRSEKLLTRRKIWEIRESDTEEHRSVQTLVTAPAGQMWLDPDFRETLERSGLDTFEAVMETTAGKQLRAVADRENWRLELHAPHGGPRGAYLKKHRSTQQRRWGLLPVESAGRVEAQNVSRLNRGGIAAMRLIAYGERAAPEGRLDSFVLTEELVGYTQLDHFLRRRFAALAEGPRDAERSRLLDAVADLAARFHKLGYNHRDLYCCHFFIKETDPGEFKVNLIDLQRVEHRRRFRSRWIVKDLAQLAYSAPRERISCTHKLAFLKRYLGVTRLRPRDKRLIRAILAKQRRMESKLGLHP